MDSPVTQDVMDSPATQTTNTTPQVVTVPPTQPTFSWKSQLPQDYANSPVIQSYEDTKDGLNAVVRSALDLKKMLGHEKVLIPKGKDDTQGWEMFSKAMGVPDKPESYNLPDVEMPDTKVGFDKGKFAEIVHQNKLTPDQAKSLWNSYTEMTKQSYSTLVRQHQEKISNIVNLLRGEWGDAYTSKVELGQSVINKFSDNKEMNDFITAALTNDPRGIKFVAKIGEQFAENKIGDFKYQRYALTADEAEKEINAIRQDMKHPYNNDKATQSERNAAIDYVNGLLSTVNKGRNR